MKKPWSALIHSILLIMLSFNAHAQFLPWQHYPSHSLRMILGTYQPDTNVIYGAFEFKLNDDWTTYWQYPGDAGLPLTIKSSYDSNQQENTKQPLDLQILWPTPKRFKYEQGLYSLGYKDHVLIPFKLPLTKNQQTSPQNFEINIAAYYGVCKQICLPFTLTEKLKFTSNTTDINADKLIADARNKMPAAISAQAIELNLTNTPQGLDIAFNQTKFNEMNRRTDVMPDDTIQDHGIEDIIIYGNFSETGYSPGLPRLIKRKNTIQARFKPVPAQAEQMKISSWLKGTLILTSGKAYVVYF